MRHGGAGFRQPRDLACVTPDGVREPGAVRQPAQLTGELVRAHAEDLGAVGGLVGRLRKVGVETDIETLRELGRTLASAAA